MLPPHRTVRSRRRTLALQVTREGELVVRAPHRLSETEIARFLEKSSAWIEKHLSRAAARPKPAPLSKEEEKRLRALALDGFIERCVLYAGKMGVEFKKIRLSSAQTRWGSCGPQGNLSFNWRLIQAPTEILDYVVVHELAHLIEHNHSRRFWAKVEEFCPDYRAARKWLREKGFGLG